MTIVSFSRLLKDVNPVLAAEWHPTKNTVLSLETIFANSGKKAWWLCSTCEYEWEAQIASRNRGNGCPRCAGKVITPENSFMLLHPVIAAEYNHERNSKPLEVVAAISHYKAWWKCLENSEHSWQAMVMNRVRQGDGCPYCSGRYATSENNLAVARPDLAAEFDLVKNAPLTPYDITPKTPKKFWWECGEGHSYQRSPNARNSDKNSNCWECKSVAFLFPHLIAEWDYDKNSRRPEETFAHSTTHKIWWKCTKKHSWQATPASRTRFGRESGCPDCIRSQTSDIEEQLRDEIIASQLLVNVNPSQNATVPDITHFNNRKYKVDILGEYKGRPIIIEWDSWYWHADVLRGGNSSYLRDTAKTETLLQANCYVIRLREARFDVSLMPLQLDNSHLLQLSYDYNAEGRSFQSFCKTLKTWLQTL